MSAQPEASLVDLINAWRASPHECNGVRSAPVPALRANPLLASATATRSDRPIDALKLRGYLATHADTIYVTGPSDAGAMMKFLLQRYCKSIAGTDVTEIGVERHGNEWNIVLARPLIAVDLGDWRKAGHDVLRLTNEARAAGHTCGGRRMPPAPPVAWDDRLAAAALEHSTDMAHRDTLTHTGSGGTSSADRVSRVGYLWEVVAENVASGQGSARQVVDSWLTSPEHCATLMDPRVTQMGAAYVLDPATRGTIWWTQDFAKPRS